MNLSAPALPLILTFSPAAKIAAGEKGKDMRLRSVLAGPETRRVRGLNISAWQNPGWQKSTHPNPPADESVCVCAAKEKGTFNGS
jgi:hypothetical protein